MSKDPRDEENYCGFYNYHERTMECLVGWNENKPYDSEEQSTSNPSNGWTTYVGTGEGSQSDYWGDLGL